MGTPDTMIRDSAKQSAAEVVLQSNGIGTRTSVLHLLTRLDRGGSAENTLVTVIGLEKSRYRVILAAGATLESKMTPAEQDRLAMRLDEVRAAGVELVTLPWLVRRISPVHDVMAWLSMVRLLRRLRPTIIHTHTSKAGVLGRLAARVCGVPVVVHTPHGHLFYGYYGPRVSSIIVRIERWLGRCTDALIALTNVGKMEYLARRISPPDSVHAIYSGVELSSLRRGSMTREEARVACGLPSEGPLIGVLGRLVQIKGHGYLLDALPLILKEFPSASLVFVGEGDERERLTARAETLGVAGHVRLVGAQLELWRYITACDLFVQPSLNEGMGRTVIEAMAMGRAVVASRVGGLPEIIAHGTTGLLVSPMSPVDLATAVCELLGDPDRLDAMGRASQERVDHRFSADAMVGAIDRLYASLLRQKQAMATNGSVRSSARQVSS